VYGDTSATPTTVIDSGTTAITTYTYSSNTISGYYYKLSVVVTNAGGSGSFTDTRYNFSKPTLTLSGASIGGGTAANPHVTANTAYATSVTFTLYVSRSFADPGTAPTNYNQVDTSTNPAPTGTDTYTYTGTTVPSKYYRVIVTASNAAGDTTTQTGSLLCGSS
jgi:hypothetical protein